MIQIMNRCLSVILHIIHLMVLGLEVWREHIFVLLYCFTFLTLNYSR
jgi:hypothetical protein